MSKVVLIGKNNDDRIKGIKSSLKELNHDVSSVSVDDISNIKKDNYSLVVLLAASKKQIVSVVPAVRSRHRLSYTPLVIIDRVNVFSDGKDEDIVNFLEKYSVDDVIRHSSDKLAAYKLDKYIYRLDVNRNLNPLTGLPGNMIINNVIEGKLLNSEERFSILYSDINDFKAYNDAYGFHAGDKVIKSVANICQNVLEKCSGDTFLGHIGGDDFVMVVPSIKISEVAGRIIRDFEKSVKDLYQPLDYERGGIISIDRKGRRSKFNLISLSLGSFSNRQKMFNNINEIGEFAGILKHLAKNKCSEKKKSYHLRGNETKIKSKSFSLLNIARDAKIPIKYRKSAIEAMGEIQEKQHEDTLFELLDGNLPYQLKKSCIYALGKLRSMKAVSRLMKLTKNPNPHLRSRAVEALANIGTVHAVPVLIKALQDSNIYTRRMAALSLGRLGDKRAIHELVRILQSNDPELKRNAISSIGELGDKNTEKLVLNMIDSRDVVLKKEAIKALGKIRSIMAVGKFLELMREEDVEIREELAEALLEIMNNCNVRDVKDYFSGIIKASEDRSPFVRGIFMSILGLLPDTGAKARLKECLKDGSGYVRWHATLALSGKQGREIVYLIIKQLRDVNEQVRIAAARALGRMGNLNALGALRLALKDSSKRVSQEAAESIINILRTKGMKEN